MKNIIITFLGMLFLSATMNVAASEAEDIKDSGTYCVELPGHDVGNSGWTKRDNHIGARWKFAVRRVGAESQTEIEEMLAGEGFGSFKTFRGNWEGEDVPSRYLYNIDHIWYSRGDRPLCVNYERLKRDRSLDARYVWIWLDIKYGNDCAKVKMSQDGGFTRMRIVKKSGDLVNPWSCNKLRWDGGAWR